MSHRPPPPVAVPDKCNTPPAEAVPWRVLEVSVHLNDARAVRTNTLQLGKFVPPFDIGHVFSRTYFQAREEAIRRYAEKGFYFDRDGMTMQTVPCAS